MSLEENEKPPPTVGFQTGRGKEVQPKKESLNEARRLLEEDNTISNDTNTTANNNTNNDTNLAVIEFNINNNPDEQSTSKPVVSFQTGRGKKVQPSKESLQKARGILGKDEEHETLPPNNNNADYGMEFYNSEQSHIPKTVGFQTGRGKKVQPTAESMKLAKNLLDNEEELENPPFNNSNTMEFNNSVQPNIPKIVGFQTARGKKVQPSKESIQKAKGLLEKEEEHEILPPINPATGEFNNNERPKTVGFQTGRGKAVQPSKDSIQKARGLLEEDHEIQPPTNSDIVEFSNDVQTDVPKSVGFQTGRGKKVQPSKDSVQKARDLFEKEDQTADDPQYAQDHGCKKEELFGLANDQIDVIPFSFDQGDEQPPPLEGFQTGKGKKVQIKETSLTVAKQILQTNDGEEDQPKMDFQGFQTGRKKPVKISEENIFRTLPFLSLFI